MPRKTQSAVTHGRERVYVDYVAGKKRFFLNIFSVAWSYNSFNHLHTRLANKSIIMCNSQNKNFNVIVMQNVDDLLWKRESLKMTADREII